MRAVSPESSPVADAAHTGAGDSRWTDGMVGFLLTGQGVGMGLSIIPEGSSGLWTTAFWVWKRKVFLTYFLPGENASKT